MSNNIIRHLLDELDSNKLLKQITHLSTFYDEPKFFHYQAELNFPFLYTDAKTSNDIISAAGSSIISGNMALLKCLVESFERLTLYCFRKKDLSISAYAELKNNALDPFIFKRDKNIRLTNFAWVKGENLTQNKSCLLPAQLIYLNVHSNFREKPLSTIISTGAAAGLTHEQTLLRGIYEIIERDAFMTTYLSKIKVPRIDLKKISSKTVKLAIEKCERYKLEIAVFNLTHDLTVPTFMTLLIDRTGLGPTMTVGIKTDLNSKNAVIGSITEAIQLRPTLKKIIMQHKTKTFNITPSMIKSHIDRGLYWSSSTMLTKLNYLLQQPLITLKMPSHHLKIGNPLTKIIDIFKAKKLDVYYADITQDLSRKNHIFVYKVIIPTLQPLYMDESRKELRINRLETVAHYFSLKKVNITDVPHPFI